MLGWHLQQLQADRDWQAEAARKHGKDRRQLVEVLYPDAAKNCRVARGTLFIFNRIKLE
jgi:hypothetical protein